MRKFFEKLFWFVLACALILALSGCDTVETSEPVMAEIVDVRCEIRVGSSDCVTVVEVGSARYRQSDRYGEEGDSIMVVIRRDRATGQTWWQSPMIHD